MTAYGSSPEAHRVLADAIEVARDAVERAKAVALAAPSCVSATSGYAPAVLADRQVHEVIAAAEALQTDLARHGFATRWAGAAYTEAESFIHSQIDRLSDSLASLLGTVLRPLVMRMLVGGVVVGGIAGAVSWALDVALSNPVTGPILQQLTAPIQALLDSAWQHLQTAFGPYLGQLLLRAMQDPTVLDIAGWLVGGADNFIFSVLGVPSNADDMEGINVLMALILPIAFGGARLGANPVRPRQVSRTDATGTGPVSSYTGGFEQIVSQNEDIVITSYEMPDGSLRYQVFVQGTQNWTMGEGESGFDMLSNLENAASARELYGTAYGLEQAMLDAGIGPDDAVDLFGYSQGGMATALVAANGTFNITSMTTYGAPTGWVDVPTDINWVQIQLAEDVVPNVAGGQQLSNSGTLIELGSVVDATSPLGYHLEEAYLPTLTWLETSDDTAALAQMRERANELIDAVAIETTAYELDR